METKWTLPQDPTSTYSAPLPLRIQIYTKIYNKKRAQEFSHDNNMWISK